MNPMKLWTMTDVGLVRKDNQDAFATRQLESGCTICVVCDGMGGAAHAVAHHADRAAALQLPGGESVLVVLTNQAHVRHGP